VYVYERGREKGRVKGIKMRGRARRMGGKEARDNRTSARNNRTSEIEREGAREGECEREREMTGLGLCEHVGAGKGRGDRGVLDQRHELVPQHLCIAHTHTYSSYLSTCAAHTCNAHIP
jgi:hypothetical protein